MKAKLYAALTGDIVDSRRLTPRQLSAVRTQVRKAVESAGQWKSGLVAGNASFFRGDSWQILLTDPSLALRVALLVRARLLAHGIADSRVSIALGRAQTVHPSDISLSTGPVFVLSGRGLDTMSVQTRLSIAVPASAGAWAPWMPAIGHICDAVVRQWTRSQARIAALLIDCNPRTQEEIGRRLRPAITQQAVSKALEGAGWYALNDVLRCFESTAWRNLLG